MDDTTAEIKQAVDIVDVVGEYVRLEPQGSKWRGLCPFHDDHKPSLQVDRVYQSFRCWACGAKGDVFAFVQAIDRISFVEAKGRLAERAGIPLRRGESAGSGRTGALYRVLAWAQDQFHKCLFEPRMGAEARQYLLERGFREATARTYGLGYAPADYDWLLRRAEGEGFGTDLLAQSGLAKLGSRGDFYDVFRGRLIFPIRSERGQVLGFGGRILPAVDTGESPKYLNTPATDVYNKSKVLFGLDVAAQELMGSAGSRSTAGRQRSLVVMEGYTDCLMAYQAGLRNSVATCGTALTTQHVAKLRQFADSVVLMFDGDAAGQKAAGQALGLFLSSELDLKLCVLPDGLDPCDFLREQGMDALQARVASADDALDFQICEARRRHSLNSLEGQRRALDDVLEVLCGMPVMMREAQRTKFDLAISRLKGAFGVDEPQLRKRLAEFRRQRTTLGPEAVADQALAMDKRERQVVQLLIAQPARAGDLESVFPAEHVQHPLLRALTEACFVLARQRGAAADVDALREQLNDRQLDALVLDLLDGAPVGEAYDRALADIQAYLAKKQRLAGREEVRRLTASRNEQEHRDGLRDYIKHCDAS